LQIEPEGGKKNRQNEKERKLKGKNKTTSTHDASPPQGIPRKAKKSSLPSGKEDKKKKGGQRLKRRGRKKTQWRYRKNKEKTEWGEKKQGRASLGHGEPLWKKKRRHVKGNHSPQSKDIRKGFLNSRSKEIEKKTVPNSEIKRDWQTRKRKDRRVPPSTTKESVI